MLFDQFKVKQSNSLKSVVTGLNSDLRDVRQENFDLKASVERNTRKIKDFEDRLSKCSGPPIVNNQTGMQCNTTTGRSPNAQKLDEQTPICTMWTDEGWTKTAKSMSKRLGELQPVIFQLA